MRIDAELSDRVTAVAVTHNSAHCLEALSRSLVGWAHVVVVDNASQDATLTTLGGSLARARVVANVDNRGFGAANNQALRLVRTPYTLLINPDCSFEPHVIATLVRCADQHPHASMVGPQLVGRHGALDVSYRWPSTAWASRGPAAEGVLCVGFMSGACMLIRTERLRAIGGFDETFFLYYEDDDLCLRLQQHGGSLIVEPAGRVVHQSRGSVGGAARTRSEYMRGFHHIQSKFLFGRKHLGGAPGTTRRVRYVVTAGLEALVRVMVLDLPRGARAWGRAVGAARWRSR